MSVLPTVRLGITNMSFDHAYNSKFNVYLRLYEKWADAEFVLVENVNSPPVLDTKHFIAHLSNKDTKSTE